MRLVRSTDSIYWLAILLGAIAWAVPGERLSLQVAVVGVAVAVAAAGLAIRRTGSQLARHFVAPALAFALPLAAALCVVAQIEP